MSDKYCHHLISLWIWPHEQRTMVSWPCRDQFHKHLSSSSHCRPRPDQTCSLCCLRPTIPFSRFGWITTGAAERGHLPSCCVTRISLPVETKLIWNSTSLHAAGKKRLLFNLCMQICNNLSRTKWCYRQWFSHVSSECMSLGTCSRAHVCTHTNTHMPARLSSSSIALTYQFSFVLSGLSMQNSFSSEYFMGCWVIWHWIHGVVLPLGSWWEFLTSGAIYIPRSASPFS